jgi:hypothetical protein
VFANAAGKALTLGLLFALLCTGSPPPVTPGSVLPDPVPIVNAGYCWDPRWLERAAGLDRLLVPRTAAAAARTAAPAPGGPDPEYVHDRPGFAFDASDRTAEPRT